MKRTIQKHIFSAMLVCLLASSAASHAAIVITVTQNGPDVTVTTKGSLKLNPSAILMPSSNVEPTLRVDSVYSTMAGNFDIGMVNDNSSTYMFSVPYSSFTASRNTISFTADDFSKQKFAAFSIGGVSITSGGALLPLGGFGPPITTHNYYLSIPSNYESDTLVGDTVTINDLILSEKNVQNGDSLSASWTVSGETQNITMNFVIIPEPGSVALSVLPALVLLRRRRI